MENSKHFWTASLGRVFLFGAAALTGVAIAGGGEARAWKLTTLYSFCAQGGANCTDGAGPGMGLVMDRWGNLCGATGGGGAYGQGTVFELTPTASGPWGQTTWTYKVLHSFCAEGGTKCTDGASPIGESVIMDASGNLYATTFFGGAYGDAAAGTGGTVWELSPNADKTIWTYKNLYNFCALANCADGQKPSAGVILAPSGKLYGAAEDGGVDNPVCNFGPHHGCGTVFELTLNAADATWKYKILYSFCAQGGTTCPDGDLPEIGLSLDGSGRLYGIAGLGGATNNGGVWELTANAPGAPWTYKVLYSFCSQPNCADGQGPQGVSFLAGNLYGPTYAGGIHNVPGCSVGLLPTVGCGTVYELSRQRRPNDTDEQAPIWTERVLYSFCAEGGAECTDGATPAAYMIRDASGRIFSTTAAGGAHNAPLCNIAFTGSSVGCGTVFELSPSAGPWGQTIWTETVLYSFCAEGGANCTDGANPYTPLIMDKWGRLYGAAIDGRAHGFGTVFELDGGPPFETAR